MLCGASSSVWDDRSARRQFPRLFLAARPHPRRDRCRQTRLCRDRREPGQPAANSAAVVGWSWRCPVCLITLPTITDLLGDADSQWFNSFLTNSEHILHDCIPERATPSYYHHQLRPRNHGKELIPKCAYSSQVKSSLLITLQPK